MNPDTAALAVFRPLTEDERLDTDGGRRRSRSSRRTSRQGRRQTRKNRRQKRKETRVSRRQERKDKRQAAKNPFQVGREVKGATFTGRMTGSEPAKKQGLLSRIISGLTKRGEMGKAHGPGNWCDDNLAHQIDIVGVDRATYLPLDPDRATVEMIRDAVVRNPQTRYLANSSVTNSGTYVFYAVDSKTAEGHTGTVTVDFEGNNYTVVHSGYDGLGHSRPESEKYRTSVVTRSGVDPHKFLNSYDQITYLRVRP